MSIEFNPTHLSASFVWVHDPIPVDHPGRGPNPRGSTRPGIKFPLRLCPVARADPNPAHSLHVPPDPNLETAAAVSPSEGDDGGVLHPPSRATWITTVASQPLPSPSRARPGAERRRPASSRSFMFSLVAGKIAMKSVHCKAVAGWMGSFIYCKQPPFYVFFGLSITLQQYLRRCTVEESKLLEQLEYL